MKRLIAIIVLASLALGLLLSIGIGLAGAEDTTDSAAPGAAEPAPGRAPELLPVQFEPPADLTTAARAALLVDAQTGQILFEHNANAPLPPASLTKLMTMRLALQALHSGRVKLTDPVHISVNAWYQNVGGSGMFLEPDTQVPFGELLKGIAIVSGNDACVAIAEHLGGTVDGFVRMMNEEARALGLTSAHFVDPHGLSDDNRISAADLARVSLLDIREFPEFLELHKQLEYTYNGITQYNRNGLLWTYEGTDGLKTGFTDLAGYNLIATAERDGQRLLAVVLGMEGANEAEGSAAREAEAAKLLTYGFTQFDTVQVARAGEHVDVLPVYKGAVREAAVVIGSDLWLTLPSGQESALRRVPAGDDTDAGMPAHLVAPLAAGEAVGKLAWELDGQTLGTVPVVTADEVPKGGFFRSLWDSIRLFFRGLFSGG